MSKFSGAIAVETTDLMSSAIEAALSRVSEMPNSLNLVDKVSKEEWKCWDASNEVALVADTAGLDEDMLDEFPPQAAA